jgi:hypothetical protein
MTSIRWNSTSILTIQLHYSTNNGSNWILMADSVPAWRTYYGWTIPIGIQSSQCLVRARNKTDSVVVDLSNAPFTIGPALQPASGKYFGGAYDGYAYDNNLPRILTVNTPNGGENWPGASTQNITWTAMNVSTIRIEFTSNNGSSWNVIQNTYPAGTGTYPWLVPGAGPLGSTQCRIRLTDVLDTTRLDESNANFTIPPSSVSVITPNGGENYKAGTMTSIRWTSASILTIQLHYSTNNGSSWSLMVDSVPAWRTYFGWTIPSGIQSAQCLVRARDKSDTVVFDVSNLAFSIGSQIQAASGKYFGGSYDGYTNDIACPIPVATFVGNAYACMGQPTTISIHLENSRPWSFQWSDGQTTQTVSSITTSPYLIQVTPTSTRTYQVTNLSGTCGAGIVSGPFVQTIATTPTAALTGPSSVCAGNSIALSLNLIGVPPFSVTYTNGTSSQTLSGITSSPYTFTLTPSQTATYSLVSVSDVCSTGIGSGIVPVQVITPPTLILSGTNTINLNSSANLQFALTGTSPWNMSYSDGTSIFQVTGLTNSPYSV